MSEKFGGEPHNTFSREESRVRGASWFSAKNGIGENIMMDTRSEDEPHPHERIKPYTLQASRLFPAKVLLR